jgi:uncharacterized membrane protein
MSSSEQTTQREKKKSMVWVLFALAAALAWGFYGAMLHRGQVKLGNPMRALLCVGIAYVLIGVLAPIFTLAGQGALNGFNREGSTWAFMGGALGAVGALFIIFAFKSGGLPAYVMPLVFGGAPLINVIVSMWMHPPKTAPNPLLYVGYLLTAGGAGLVLYYKPPA